MEKKDDLFVSSSHPDSYSVYTGAKGGRDVCFIAHNYPVLQLRIPEAATPLAHCVVRN
jgi:hypothetical protein